MRKVRTICGDIRPEQLGYTSMHEHTLYNEKKTQLLLLKSVPAMIRSFNAYEGGADIREEASRRESLGLDKFPQSDLKEVISSLKLPKDNPARKLKQIDFYVNEIEAFKKVGGQAICDCTPSIKEKSSDMIELTRQTGIHIITATGFYTEASIPKRFLHKGQKYMMDLLKKGLEGVDDTSSGRPGFLKCAISALNKDGTISSAELMSVRACAMVAKETRMSLHIHVAFPIRKLHVLQVADLLEKEIGINPDKVLFCHMDSFNIGSKNMAAQINEEGFDDFTPIALMKRGFHIGLDTWGSPSNYPEIDFDVSVRTSLLINLIKAGFIDKITLGHDFISKSKGVQNNGFGYTFTPQYMQRLIREKKITEEDVWKLTVGNPAHILAF